MIIAGGWLVGVVIVDEFARKVHTGDCVGVCVCLTLYKCIMMLQLTEFYTVSLRERGEERESERVSARV